MGFDVVGHRAAHRRLSRRGTPNAACKTGGFYQAPTNQQSVDSLQPLQIKWDTSCLETQKADIYLYAPSAAKSRVAVWENVDFTKGSVSVDLMPRWWNATASINLQLGIVPAGQAPFQSFDIPAGPVFTATYSKPSSGNVPAAADTSIASNPVIDMDQKLKDEQSHGMTPGKKAAAVLIPLLVIIGAIVYYIRWQRKKADHKSKRFSVAVDKRMSTISTDWKSVTPAGANAAIRHSMAVAGNRASSFSFGGIRPGSTFGAAEDGNQAGIGIAPGSPRQMSQLRTGVGLRDPSSLTGERVSRVSFADTVNRQSRVSFANDPRPSTDSARRTRAQNEYIPPVPSLPPQTATAPVSSNDDASSVEGDSISPRQTQGPLTLTPEDIRARIAASSRARSASNATPPVPPKKDEITYDDVLPALSMMRTDHNEEFLLPSPPPQSHSPLHPATYSIYMQPTLPASPPPPSTPQGGGVMSPIMGSMPMPANVMSPDEMLRAYAERKKNSMSGGIMSPPPVAAGIPLPMSPPPVAVGGVMMSPQNTGGTRPLFGPTGVVSPTNTGGGPQQQYGHYGRGQGGMGVGTYGGARYEIGDDEDPYGGTA